MKKQVRVRKPKPVRVKYLAAYPGYCFSDMQWLRECGIDGAWDMRDK